VAYRHPFFEAYAALSQKYSMIHTPKAIFQINNNWMNIIYFKNNQNLSNYLSSETKPAYAIQNPWLAVLNPWLTIYRLVKKRERERERRV